MLMRYVLFSTSHQHWFYIILENQKIYSSQIPGHVPNTWFVNNFTYLSFVCYWSKRKICDIDELREQLTATWQKLEQLIIDAAIDQWRQQLTAYVKAKNAFMPWFCDKLIF